MKQPLSENFQSILMEQSKCDLCNKEHDIIDLTPCPSGTGYYCQDCVDCGDAASYIKRHALNITDAQINKLLNKQNDKNKNS